MHQEDFGKIYTTNNNSNTMFKNNFRVLEEKHDYSDDNMKISRHLSTVKLIEMTFNNV